MAGKLREVRRRIRTVQSTMKITRAMDMIAASRIVKAQRRVDSARPYAEAITAMTRDLGGTSGGAHPLLAKRESVANVGLVVITSDRGLAGAYNSNVIRNVQHTLASEMAGGRGYRLYLVGRKGISTFRYQGYDIAETWAGVSDTPSYEAAEEISERVIEDFNSGDVDAVRILYTEFRSALVQRVANAPLLPVEEEVVEAKGPTAGFIFEPSSEEILASLMPRYVVSKVFSAMLEAAASEHAARRRAMKAATDNAEELIKHLARVANRARQTEITTEISEIVGGAEALRQASGE
ncbi:MAG: F0F1 ATP synthase subunit gamma [Actinomycetota bacterium]